MTISHMTISHQTNFLAEEATIIGETLAESRAIAALGGGSFSGGGALASARNRAASAEQWMARHPEASATARPRPIGARPINRLAQELLRRGAHIADVRHMVTYI
jgi:shikimate kinase